MHTQGIFKISKSCSFIIHLNIQYSYVICIVFHFPKYKGERKEKIIRRNHHYGYENLEMNNRKVDDTQGN